MNEPKNDILEYELYTEQPSTQDHPVVIMDPGVGGIGDGAAVWMAAMILKLSIVAAFVVTTWVALRTLDWLNGQCFAQWLNSTSDDNKCRYYSVRFVAVVLGSAIVYAFGAGL